MRTGEETNWRFVAMKRVVDGWHSATLRGHDQLDVVVGADHAWQEALVLRKNASG